MAQGGAGARACGLSSTWPSPYHWRLAGSALADEVIHLGSAFHTAGFRHVIGTLWRVTDGTATETARLFYDNLPPDLDADQAAQALHTTAVELRTRYPQFPARWAGYVHIGP